MRKSKPILFSPAMIAAILDGRKTQTRRIMKTQMPENFWRIGGIDKAGEYAYAVPLADEEKDDHLVKECKFPYGNIGDRLWVREEHYRYGYWTPVHGRVTKKGKKQKYAFVAASDEVLFKAPEKFRKSRDRSNPPDHCQWYKRLARFMPRSLSRIELEITDIRVERLNDISEADARIEGFPSGKGGHDGHTCYDGMCRHWFKGLWEGINGDDSWEANPWVWVISFKVVNTGEKSEKDAA